MRRGRPHVLDHDPLERSERRKGFGPSFLLGRSARRGWPPGGRGTKVVGRHRAHATGASERPARLCGPLRQPRYAGVGCRLRGTGTGALVRWPKMKAFRSFTVRARLPEPLAPLQELAFNLRWSWDDRTRDLFRWVDPQLWDRTQHDPVQSCSSWPESGWKR